MRFSLKEPINYESPLIMKTRVKSGFYEVMTLSATSVCSINNKRYATVFACAHQVRKYAYWMKQNVFNRFHILNVDHCRGYIFNVIVSNAN